MRTVNHILHSKTKANNFINPTARVIDALQMLNSVNLSYLIVMDSDQYKGLFCERDYSRNVILKGRSSEKTTVSEVMTVDLPVVTPTDTVEYCMNLMNSHKGRYLLVFDRRHFKGVITIHDLLRQVIVDKEQVFDEDIAARLLEKDEGDRGF
jgi:CBS domain-containing protein